ncbi:MAG: hypothetical protein ACUVQW_04320 [Candidatus Bathycorpusculaceae bacterium]
MKTKIFALIILAIITLTTIGYSYACWNGGITINCYCYCDVKFTKATAWDNENEKDVGKVYATIDQCGDEIEVYVTNAYPCYEAYVNFTIKNKGNMPAHIDEIETEYNTTALEITLTDIIECTWISNYESKNGSLTIHTLQEAQENHTYTLKIKIKLSCQPQQHPRTIGFWKNQFDKALCKPGKPQIDPDTLEQYLDKISANSPIYEFTGTRTQKFKNASKILSPPWRSNMEAKLKAQLLALWLNYVAGWTEGWKLNGMTAWQIIQGSENALINNQIGKYRYWKDLCERFNNLG